MSARESSAVTRRESLAFAGASVLALSTPAFAASKPATTKKAAPDPISTSETDGAFTTVLVSHGTRNSNLYSDLIDEEYFVTDPKTKKRTINPKVFSDDIGVIRNIIGTSVDAKGQETVHNLITFRNKGLGPMAEYLDQKKNPLWKELRKQGVVQGTVHVNYNSPAIWRGALPGPPKRLQKGTGVTYAQLPLKNEVEAFADWEEIFLSPQSNAFHATAGVFSSSAGIMCPQTLEASTDVKGYEDGVGIVHFTPSGEQAALLSAKLAPLKYVTSEKGVDSPLGKGAFYSEFFTVTDDLIFPAHPPFATKKAETTIVGVPPKIDVLTGEKPAGLVPPGFKILG